MGKYAVRERLEEDKKIRDRMKMSGLRREESTLASTFVFWETYEGDQSN